MNCDTAEEDRTALVLVSRYHAYFMHSQIQNNWTFGEVLDEIAKTHPMLRPYKTFSEKVKSLFVYLFIYLVVIILQKDFHCVFLNMCLLCCTG